MVSSHLLLLPEIPGVPPCNLITNQKKVTHPAYESFALKTTEESVSFLNTNLLIGPAINLCLLQTPTFQFVWPHCESGICTCVQQHYHIYTQRGSHCLKYRCPLSHTHLNYTGPLIHGLFSTVNTTAPNDPRLVESTDAELCIWKAD